MDRHGPHDPIAEKVRILEEKMSQQSLKISRLKEQNSWLTSRVQALEHYRDENPIVGLIKGRVQAGSEDTVGEPAVLDNQGNVKVEVEGLDVDGEATKTEVAVPWLAKDSGIQFLPRQGQAVYVGYVHDDTQLTPVIVGYNANQNDSLPHPPFSSGKDQKDKKEVPLEWGDASDDWKIEKDSSGEDTKSKNKYKSTISSTSRQQTGSKAKKSEIIFTDEPGLESLSLGSQGKLNLRAVGDHNQLVSGDSSMIVDGVTKREGRKGREATYIGYDRLTVKKADDASGQNDSGDPEDKKGNRTVTVDGDEKHNVKGNYTLEIEGKYKMSQVESWAEKHYYKPNFDFHWGPTATFAEELSFSQHSGIKVSLNTDFEVGINPLSGYFKYNFPFGVTLNLGYFKSFDLIQEVKKLLGKKMTLADMDEKLTEMGETLANMNERMVELRNGAAQVEENAVQVRNDTIEIGEGEGGEPVLEVDEPDAAFDEVFDALFD
jgi:hypothetical protein